MAMETKQLHNLSRIYRERIAEGKGKDLFKKNEIKGTKGGKKPGDIKLPDITGGKKIQAEGVYDTVKTVMDKGSNFIKKNPVGKVLGKVVAPVKSTDGGSNRTSPTAASQKAKGLRTEALGGVPGDGYIGHPKLDIKNPISPPKKVTNKSGNKGLTGTLGNRSSQTSDAMKEEKKAAKVKNNESFSNWRQDLKEIPDYEQIPASDKKRNEKISEKNVKNTIKINPEMKEEVVDENLINFIKNPKATIQKAVDKKLTSATKKGSIGGIKVGGSAKYTGSIGSGPLNTEGKRWQDDDGDGKWYEKSDVDGKISKREKKAKNHNCASKVKHEQFGVGDCISEAHDLDENGNVAHYDVEFEEYIVKGVPVEELEILEGHMHEHVIREKEESKIKNCGCGQDPCVTYGEQKEGDAIEEANKAERIGDKYSDRKLAHPRLQRGKRASKKSTLTARLTADVGQRNRNRFDKRYGGDGSRKLNKFGSDYQTDSVSKDGRSSTQSDHAQKQRRSEHDKRRGVKTKGVK